MEFKMENLVSLEEGLKSYAEIQDIVLAEYANRGFTLPQAPQQLVNGAVQPYYGSIPEDLTALDDRQLGQYMSLLSLWLEYVGAQQTLADLSYTIAKSQLDVTEALIYLSYKTDDEGKKLTVEQRKSLTKADRRFIHVNKNCIYLEKYLTLVGGVYRSASHNYKAISRRITQRGQEIERGQRNANVGGAHSPGPGAPLFPGRRG